MICRTAYTFEAECQCTPGMDGSPCDLAKRRGGRTIQMMGQSEVGPNEWAPVWSRKGDKLLLPHLFELPQDSKPKSEKGSICLKSECGK